MALPQDLLMAPSIKIAGHLKLAEIVYKQVVQYNFIISILLSVTFRVFRERVPSEPGFGTETEGLFHLMPATSDPPLEMAVSQVEA